MTAPTAGIPNSKTILIVDDDRTICEFLELLLTRKGYKVLSTNFGEQALELLKSDRPVSVDLLVIDLMLPGRGGIDIVKELQKPDYHATPILIVAARVLNFEGMNFIRNEPNVKGFFHKPINNVEFIEKIQAILGPGRPA